jgi:hypothetical protein
MNKNRQGKSNNSNQIRYQGSSPTEASIPTQQDSTNTQTAAIAKVRSADSKLGHYIGIVLAGLTILGALWGCIWWLTTLRHDVDSINTELSSQNTKINQHDDILRVHEKENTENKIKIEYFNEQIKKQSNDIEYINKLMIEKSK